MLAAALTGRAAVLRLMGRTAEAAGDARRALALARQTGDPVQELLALVDLSFDADYAGDMTRRYGWPGRPGRSRPGSPARPPGRAAIC